MVRPVILYLNDRSWAIESESGMMWMAAPQELSGVEDRPTSSRSSGS